MGKENTKGMGITDMPCTSEEEDLLEISKYVKGLGKFIRECQTPMSIAIQGDWGTGKTSTLNLLKKNLEADKDTNGIKCVFFNTWQYSQFNMEDSLYVSFVHNLVKQCGGNDEILRIVAAFGKLAFFKAVDWRFGANASEILDGFEKAKKAQMESVSKLQEDFAKLVKKTGKRLVIFIDDLDRLNPEVAVELLEIIKLFVNVENSIFVLAIDYEVVVKGVRKKYGENLSEEKCRNFFDKIIQLPFKMPVERYNLTELVRKAVQEQTHMTDEGVNIVDEIGEEAESKTKEINDVLMFCSLCIQMCLPKLYELMVTASTKKQLKELLEVKAAEEIRTYLIKYFIDMEGTDKEFNEIIKGIRLFHEEVLNPVSEKFKEEVVLEALFGLLAVTSITMVSADTAANSGRKAATKITHIRINEKEIAVASANAAIVETFRALLGKNMSYMEEFMLQNPAFLTNEETKKDSMFRQHKLLLRDGDTTIYLGVSSGTEAKIKQVAKLCQFLKDKGQINQVKWLNGEDELFCFLPEIENN